MINRELEIFIAVAECGKMGAAAQKLYITQSSVSQSISSIEKEFGVRLFERISHSLYLTDVGETLLQYARSLSAVTKDMDAFLRSASGYRRLRVGATVTVGTCVIGPVLNTVKAEIPEIRLNVCVANTRLLEDMLIKNEIDAALVEGAVKNPDLVYTPVIKDRLVLICPPGHEFWGRESVRAEELSSQSLILRESGSGTRALFESQMAAKGIPLDITWQCYNSEAIKNAVIAGHGVSVISQRLVENELRSGALCACGIEGIELERYFSIVHHKNKLITKEIECFFDACTAAGNAS